MQEILRLIGNEYSVTGDEALDMFYNSRVGECFSQDDSGLYGQSALYIFSLFKQEKDN
jgi:hypothetical protein